MSASESARTAHGAECICAGVIGAVGMTNERLMTDENDVLHEQLRQDLAAIIRSVEPGWLTRGYGDADLRNKVREWGEKVKGA